ncbi:RDD family protein [Streptomyces sp. NPDC058417]|uniref:RDD family protein n=2 Tax=Streptomyces TaxID=1883 RepID=UPI003667934C
MSAPTPAPGDDRPREGYYPDPSIPGYVRYWNGASWVPGTSRPAPSDGGPLAAPGGGAAPAAPVEETGPHFFDEDPAPVPADTYGSRPEPAAAWGADRVHQSGFGGDQDRRVSWGNPQGPQGPQGSQRPHGPQGPQGSHIPQASPSPQGLQNPQGPDPRVRQPEPGPDPDPRPAPAPAPAADRGTLTFGPPAGTAPAPNTPSPAVPSPAGEPFPAAAGQAPLGVFGPAAPPPAAPAPAPAPAAAASAAAPAQPGFGAGRAAAERATATPGAPAGPAAPSVPAQGPGPASGPAPASDGAPLSSGPGGGQPSWAQQVHRLAAPGAAGAAGAGEQPVVPWKPPVDDVFQAAARRQAAARPAGIGRRLVARLVDTVVLAAVTSAAAVPLGVKALDHVDAKIEAARLTGQTVTVWLLDGTTSAYLGVVLGVLLVFGIVYEALPTARWGRTLGKKLLGLEVRDIEAHEPPSFGAALRRWLVYSVPGLLAVGVIGVLWGLFDRPWRQCWHDKAAHTFVAG